MRKSTSQWNNKFRVATREKTFFGVPLWWKLRKLDNHHSILTCAQTGIFIMAQESFMDTFSELTSFSSSPSPSSKRWIKRRSVLEAWTSCTYLWWTVNETRSALFSIKWGLRQNWVYDIWSRRRKVSGRNLVGDSPTEQFLRSRGLRQKQTFPHLVSQHRKTTWGSLLEYSLTEQIISSNIVSNRLCKNVLPFVMAYQEKVSERNVFFSYTLLWY